MFLFCLFAMPSWSITSVLSVLLWSSMAVESQPLHPAEERRKGKNAHCPADQVSLISLPRSHANPIHSQLVVLNLAMWPYLTGRDWEIKFLTGGIAASCGIMVLSFFFFLKKKRENVFTLDGQLEISATKRLAQLRDLPSRTLLSSLCFQDPSTSGGHFSVKKFVTILEKLMSENFCLLFCLFFGSNNHFPVTLTNLYSSTP